ncbi:TPA: hypothetical protein ACH3X3_002978 [Trebouxia sp. C0006]
MAANPTLNTCFVPEPFIPARILRRRDITRQCCEVPSAASQLHQPSRSQFFQSSQFNKAVKSTSIRSMDGAAGRQLHPTDLEECLQPFVTPESQWWDWKYNSRIHYRQQGSSGPCILLVHGFGVGSFHFEQLIQKLSSAYQVWAVDLLGQGMSWPAEAPAPEEQLRYSIETWTDQLRDFVTQVIQQPVYLAGNSLGGLLSAHLAATQAHLCRGVIFLNATPFWSFMPHPETAPRLVTAILPWNGTLPVPRLARFLVKNLWWNLLSRRRILQSLVRNVYADKSAADDALVDQIIASTQHPLALDAFVSILFAPQARLSFDGMAAAMQCPVCMIYGREDPWVVPLWGQRLKRLLADAVYLEISPAGHCPHHEAPTAVHEAMSGWLQSVETSSSLPWAVGQQWRHQKLTVTHVDGSPRNVFEKADVLWYALRQRLFGKHAVSR